jgi:hypothetical protein
MSSFIPSQESIKTLIEQGQTPIVGMSLDQIGNSMLFPSYMLDYEISMPRPEKKLGKVLTCKWPRKDDPEKKTTFYIFLCKEDGETIPWHFARCVQEFKQKKETGLVAFDSDSFVKEIANSDLILHAISTHFAESDVRPTISNFVNFVSNRELMMRQLGMTQQLCEKINQQEELLKTMTEAMIAISNDFKKLASFFTAAVAEVNAADADDANASDANASDAADVADAADANEKAIDKSCELESKE